MSAGKKSSDKLKDDQEREEKTLGILDLNSNDESSEFGSEDLKRKEEIYPELIMNDPKVHDLMWRYQIKEKTSVADFVIKEFKNLEKNGNEGRSVNGTISSGIAKVIDYNALQGDLKRLESYDDLSKLYKLTEVQIGEASAAYNRIKKANDVLSKMDDSYKSISERTQEMTNISSQIMGKIKEDSYIKEDPNKWYI